MSTTTEAKIVALTAALIAGRDAADAIPDVDTGGTCNFDAPHLHLKGWRQENVKKAADAAGLRIHKWSNGHWDVPINSAQGSTQTAKAQAFVTAYRKLMGEDSAHVHYAMD